ncbi:MAG: N-6 DNA methylase [Melioribacteraceae bacterium]|nr:N-6 DNA methylase [Melioribacteraceae bacterium]
MPSGVFKPYAGVSTAVIIFTKTNSGGTDNVWFYDMKADGYSLDDKRDKIEDDDIPDIIERYHNLDEESRPQANRQKLPGTEEEIVNEKYDLSINRYKEIEYEEVEYDSPKTIINGKEGQPGLRQLAEERLKAIG